MYAKMQQMGMQGVVSKKQYSYSSQAKRGLNWLKTPIVIRQVFVVGGWVESDYGWPFAPKPGKRNIIDYLVR